MNLIQRDYDGIRKSIIQQQTVAMTVTYDIIKQRHYHFATLAKTWIKKQYFKVGNHYL